jgi:hypothetical protein
VSVSSIGSNSAVYTPAARPQAEAGEAQAAGREVQSDGDSDDGGTAAKAPAPTVNLDGQSVGKLINVTA